MRKQVAEQLLGSGSFHRPPRRIMLLFVLPGIFYFWEAAAYSLGHARPQALLACASWPVVAAVGYYLNCGLLSLAMRLAASLSLRPRRLRRPLLRRGTHPEVFVPTESAAAHV